MQLRRPVFAFAAAALAGCGSLGFLTDERPNSTQQDAIADAIDQAVTIATTLDDPASASDADLVTIMTFDHLVFLIAPELASGGAQARVAAPSNLGDCYTDDGAGTIELAGCQVSVPGADVLCVVDGTFHHDDTSFDGGAALSGETCPARTIDFALELAGPLDAPTAVTGELRMTDADPEAGTDLDLTATIELGVADGCDVPSEGTIDVEVSGTFRGEPVDGARTVVFHADPECGYLSLE